MVSSSWGFLKSIPLAIPTKLGRAGFSGLIIKGMTILRLIKAKHIINTLSYSKLNLEARNRQKLHRKKYPKLLIAVDFSKNLKSPAPIHLRRY